MLALSDIDPAPSVPTDGIRSLVATLSDMAGTDSVPDHQIPHREFELPWVHRIQCYQWQPEQRQARSPRALAGASRKQAQRGSRHANHGHNRGKPPETRPDGEADSSEPPHCENHNAAHDASRGPFPTTTRDARKGRLEPVQVPTHRAALALALAVALLLDGVPEDDPLKQLCSAAYARTATTAHMIHLLLALAFGVGFFAQPPRR
ncbi:hypothetical protein [Streptacidiphilus rugosus]|uniref:hypothetical protein n=1 Tax=Streptacidiphilus rugosus TaxID=405783 RepID=UPI002FBD7BE2